MGLGPGPVAPDVPTWQSGHPGWSRRTHVLSPSLGPPPTRRRTAVFYILIFGLLAVVLVVAFAKKWSSRNRWPEDE